jgi:hypothetical protein
VEIRGSNPLGGTPVVARRRRSTAIGAETAWQDIVIGLVLVAAVGVDMILRRSRA